MTKLIRAFYKKRDEVPNHVSLGWQYKERFVEILAAVVEHVSIYGQPEYIQKLYYTHLEVLLNRLDSLVDFTDAIFIAYRAHMDFKYLEFKHNYFMHMHGSYWTMNTC